MKKEQSTIELDLPVQVASLQGSARSKNEKPDKDTKKKPVKPKKTLLIRKKPTLNMMAQAMRLFFVKHLRKQLNTGRIQTKYLSKFEVSSLPTLLFIAVTDFFIRSAISSPPSASSAFRRLMRGQEQTSTTSLSSR